MENLTGRPAQIPGWCCSRWAGLALVAAVFVLAAALSWRRWPDLLVDFGIQLYLPWRISEGDVLYRDVMYLTGGPLSQYFNALLFKIFGVSFRTLIFANLAITAGMLVLVYRRFLVVADQLTATMICLGIVLVFAFQQLTPVGNYNYVTPYCHEVFHGLVLSIVAVMWLSDWVEKGRIQFALAAGLTSGLVFLTKPDVFLALMVCAAAAFVVVGCFQRRTGFAAKSLVGFLLAGAIPVLAFFALFLRAEDWRASARSVVSAWAPLWHTSITLDPFYQWCMGWDMPFHHLEKMVGQFIFIAVITVFYALVFWRGMESIFKWGKPPWLVWPLLMAPLLVFAAVWSWIDCGRSLLLLDLSACVLLGLNSRKTTAGPAVIFPLLWNLFSLALLAKLGLFTRVWHYGFALAMPAFAGMVYLYVWLLPLLLEQKYRVRFHLFRLTACLVLGIGFVRLFLLSESHYLRKNLAVGGDGDKIMAYGPATDPFHGTVETALSWVEQHVPPDATLAVLPEGAIINYLSRRVNPTHHLAWFPPVMAVFGQANMTDSFEKDSPDYVVIIARSATEFGVGFFGYDPRYGAGLKQWVDNHYDRVYPDPAEQSSPERPFFAGLQILKRRPPVLPAGNN
ncbi:MAG: hypothetical protein WAO02_07815 [Verrucomicrobiia bacterium]